jgi:beta-lactamase regulating signal transducer with metallopeptidase domain
MTAIETWLREPASQAIGWALLQFLWQGAVVGTLTALALLALRRSAADVRYLIASIGLAVMMTLPIVTGVQKYQTRHSDIANGGAAVFHDGVAAGAGGERFTFDRLEYQEPAGPTAPQSSASPITTRSRDWQAIMPVFLLVWSVGVLLLTLRLMTGWLWVQRLRTRGVTAATADIRQIAARLGKQLHITRTMTVVESVLVDVPTVIGFLAPVVLLPASTLAGLTPRQLEAILAHELAHIRRHDYLVNLLQTLVETVLFYHPAVWWLSRRIRVERENCCDDLAVGLCGDPVAYATALADLEALRSGPAPDGHLALAATGGSLLHRVRRVLGAPASHSGRGPAWLAGAVALLLVGGIAAGAQAARPERVPAAPPASAEPHLAAAPAAPAVPPAPPESAAPETPAVPAVPAASAVEQSTRVEQSSSDSHGSWSWSNNGDHLEVTYSGTFEFTDDDTDVRQLSAGGSLKISDGRWLGRHSVEIRERNGKLEYHYYVNAAERPFEPEGRAWLRQNLPRFVRNTGLGADMRVARLLKNGGPAAVMTEIGRIDSAYVKRIYFTQLFRQAALTPEQYLQALTQAGREMSGSSYELAQLLIGIAERLPADEASKAAYFQAASGIRSDYELRRVLSTMIKRGPLSPSTLGGVLASARSIGSDYEQAELLRQILAQQAIDERNREAFFAAVATIGGAYERHRVLSAVVGGPHPGDAGLLGGVLAAASRIGSDYDTSTFLQEVLRAHDIEAVRAPFFTVVGTIGGAYERGRVLQAVVRKPGTSDDTLRLVLQSSRAMTGYELSQLLQLVARSHALNGDLRDAYVAAADRLGGYEQTQTLAALARSERPR